jgi:hypothetical protein
MKCLYGDYSPSPLDDNFLDLLPALVSTAANLLRLHDATIEIRERAEIIRRKAEQVRYGLDGVAHEFGLALQTFSHQHEAAEEAERLVRDVVDLVNRHRQDVAERQELALTEQEAALADVRRQAVPLVGEFLLKHPLPESEWRTLWRYHKGSNSAVSAEAHMSHPSGLAGCVGIKPPAGGRWADAVKVGSFVPDLIVTLPQPSILNNNLKRSKVRLHSYFIVSVDVSNQTERMTLSKTLTGKGNVYRLEKDARDGSISVALESSSEGDTGTTALTGVDHDEVDALFEAVSHEAYGLYQLAREVKSLTFEGQPLEELDDLTRLVVLLFDSLAPAVTELCQRSPNPRELALKRATGHRKREEIFLPLDELLAPIESLRPEHQFLFSRLGINLLPIPAPALPDYQHDIDLDEVCCDDVMPLIDEVIALAPADADATGPDKPLGTPLPHPLEPLSAEQSIQGLLPDTPTD